MSEAFEIYGYGEDGKPLRRPAGLGAVLTEALAESRRQYDAFVQSCNRITDREIDESERKRKP
jgi:hypothetical protein